MDNDILIAVEDFQLARSLVRQVEKLNFRVTGCAFEDASAIEMARTFHPRAVLIDVELPHKGGFELAAKLRQEMAPGLVAVVRDDADEALIDRVSTGGFGACISPSATIAELRRALCFSMACQRRQEDQLQVVGNLVRENQHLKKEIEAMETSLSDKADNISMLAHELKNPLSGLIGIAEVLVRKYKQYNDLTREELISQIYNSGKDLYSLLESLLLWSRLQSSKLPFTPVDLNATALTESVMDLYSPAARQKGIRLHNETGGDLMVHGDTKMLQTIIRNLLSNAIKFSDEGGIISVESAQEAGFIRLTVKDTGTGIDADTLALIMNEERMISTTGTGGEKGTGLGLGICLALAKKHGGRITATSRPGKGSAFSLWIPAEQGKDKGKHSFPLSA